MGKKIGQLVKKLRGKMSQAEFAKVVGIYQQEVSTIETGKREPSKRIARKLAAYFQMPVDKFLGGD